MSKTTARPGTEPSNAQGIPRQHLTTAAPQVQQRGRDNSVPLDGVTARWLYALCYRKWSQCGAIQMDRGTDFDKWETQVVFRSSKCVMFSNSGLAKWAVFFNFLLFYLFIIIG